MHINRAVPLLAGLIIFLAGCANDSPTGLTTSKTVGECERYASIHGRDSWPGTLRRPFRTVRRLQRALGPGRTACLRRGRYRGSITIRHGGSPGRPAGLRPYRGEHVTLLGRLHIARGADDLSIQGLRLDGRNPGRLPSPTVNADRVSFIRVDATNRHTGICFGLGSREYGAARGTLIIGSRIHNCGRLPATNHDHGIYVEEATDTRIVGNWIYDNADRGVQLYPNAQRTTVVGNTIVRNGTGIVISGDHGLASKDSRITGNVISHSLLRFNVESYYPPGNPIGVGNEVARNCVFGGARGAATGGIQIPPRGFSLSANVQREPSFANPAAQNFRILEPSGCRAQLGDWAGTTPGTAR